MLKVSGKVESCAIAREVVIAIGAQSSGTYEFKDRVYCRRDDKNQLSEEIVRIRMYSKNNRASAGVQLCHKTTEWEEGIQTDGCLFDKAFDSKEEAREFVNAKYADWGRPF